MTPFASNEGERSESPWTSTRSTVGFPRYNIPRGEDVLAIISEGERQARMLSWGLTTMGYEGP